MKRKLLITLLAVVAAVTFALGLTACDSGGGGNGTQQHAHPLEYHQKIEPSCLDDGHEEYLYCPTCQKYFSVEDNSEIEKPVIPTTGHDFGEWDITEATCIETGEKTRACATCGYKEKKTVPAKGHSFGGGKCSVCNRLEPSAGLHYKKVQENHIEYIDEYYICDGIGDCTETDIVIADFYDGLKVRQIADEAFKDNAQIKSVTTNGIETIGTSAFEGCASLNSVTLSEGLKWVQNCAFKSCTALTDVVLPDSATHWYHEVFADCANLKSVKFGKGIQEIGYKMFRNCKALTDVTITNGVTGIQNSAFEGCSALEDIQIPDSVTYIGGDAFTNCDSLKKVTVPDSVTEIYDYAFSYCDSLTSVKLSENLTAISDMMFKNCKALEGIYIPDSVTSIGEHAFEYCQKIISVKIPKNVTTIGVSPFYGCTALESLRVDKENKVYHSIEKDVDSVMGCREDLLIETATKKLIACTNDTEQLILPEDGSILTIGRGVTGGLQFTVIMLPESVTKLEDFAFYGCKYLSSIQITTNVQEIGYCIFGGAGTMADITIEYAGTEAQWDAIKKDKMWIDPNTHYTLKFWQTA